MANQETFMDDTEKFMDPLYSYARRLTLNDTEAEDLLQETYLKAYTHFDKFKEGTNIRAWMYKIMTNAFLTYYQKTKTKPAVDRRTIDGEMADVYVYDSCIDERYRHFGSAETEFLEQLGDEEIKTVLDEMPEHQRVPVLLADVEGFSYQEIADFMEIPIGTVMSRLSRGRKTLTGELHDIGKRYGYVEENIDTHETNRHKNSKQKIAVA